MPSGTRPSPNERSVHHGQNLFVLDEVAHPEGCYPLSGLQDYIPVPKVIDDDCFILDDGFPAETGRNPY